MEISGKLIKIMPEVRGESARGPWVKSTFVIETDGEYPRTVAFNTFGEDRLAMVNSIPLNSPVIVSFTPESREYQDRWYTDLRCTRIQSYVPGQMPPQAAGYPWPAAAPAAAPMQPAMTPNPAAPQQPAPQQVAPAATQPFASPLKPEEDLPF